MSSRIKELRRLDIKERIRIRSLPPKARAQAIKQSKQDKRLQARWKFKSSAQKLFRRELSSSFVSQLSWNSETGTVNVLLSNKKYSFLNVPEALFTAWRKGAATCVTSDNGKKKQWWKGKTPSLGAFFNDKIKNDYSFVRGWVD